MDWTYYDVKSAREMQSNAFPLKYAAHKCIQSDHESAVSTVFSILLLRSEKQRQHVFIEKQSLSVRNAYYTAKSVRCPIQKKISGDSRR